MIKDLKEHIPILFRKKIKFFFNKLFLKKTKNNKINQKIIKEFNKRNIENYDIINFSIISWNYRFQRPQQLSKQFASKKHRVFYIDNDFLLSNSKNHPISISKIDNNIYDIKLSSTNNYFIYTDIVNSVDRIYIHNSIKNLIKTANIKKAIIKIDHPFWYQVCKNLEFPIIYDCMDDHGSFKETSKKIVELEKELIKKSNLVVTTSNYLKEKINLNNKKNIQIGNGVDFNLFNQKPSKNIPIELKNIKKPIIGYYGAINSWIDVNVIKDIITKRPNYNLVMIGRIENKQILNLQKYKNLFLLGEKKYSEIKNYLDCFDVCIIPFRLTTLIKATDPVKIYEFLASEKKIFSAKIPSILKYKKVISFYNKQNLLYELDILINSDNTNIKEKKIIAKQHSWEKLAIKYLESIKKLI